jgi:hypothetical protein
MLRLLVTADFMQIAFPPQGVGQVCLDDAWARKPYIYCSQC